ncbi:1-phosphofructokinase [Intrasporangium calvum]|uniref:1-phosphofructokinase n=1 Tax=Intrasporangium calvum (strain ATCC 23552 / DSM 43043 / JCM 3097 / NBRC 12989 / NCIMB 10167 / NRRL B-3866 / 7 KIP) TaxID=710696 RepID=E6SDR3_INTC7|nr:1-phosphofructokinase [Intrasporangium calvum]ADU49744.1 fructose-1-phosphate kinase [Intrasporangium calvum DSM 43043]AXG14606.1 1-phosphofructokinase [Intrasporangium calvum]
MIVTLTPNPSIDRAVFVDDLVRGAVHRATGSRVDPGGKGVNVSRALAAQGAATTAVLPTGGPEGHLLQELLDEAGVAHRGVPVSGPVRMNISVLEPDGTTTKLNEPGPVLSDVEVEALVATTLEQSAGAAWVVGCGSLPPGAPADLYATLVTRVRGRGGRVAIDSSGAPLAAAVAARPHLVKPNHEELAELVGHSLPTLEDVRAAARDLVTEGIETVAVSLGSDGALLVTAESVIHARATISAPLSTVGAGDCMLAGLLHALSSGLPAGDALATGVLWGAAAVTLPGSRVPAPADLRGISVQLTHDPDLSRTLAH